MSAEGATGGPKTERLLTDKKQNLDEAYAAPSDFLEIDVIKPETHGLGKNRYTDYEVVSPAYLYSSAVAWVRFTFICDL